MEKYSEYKDCNIQGINSIPKDWHTIYNRHIFKEEVRSPNVEDRTLSLSQKDGLIYSDDLKETTLRAASHDNWKRVLEGDLVLNRFKAHLGVIFASKYVGIVSFHYGVFKNMMPIVPKYYEYMFHIQSYKELMAGMSNGMIVGLQNLSNSNFYSFKSLYPPLSEQQSIVEYLDKATAKMDKFVTKKEQEIELLEKLKQRIIADAVTKGLDPNAEMVPCDIPWIKQIPKGWTTMRAKYMFKKEDRPVREEDGVVTCFRDGEVTLRKNRRTTGFTESLKEIGYQGIRKGDLVIHQMDAFAGSCGVSDSDGKGSPVLSVCTAKIEGLNNEYYAKIVRLMGLNGYIQSLYRGIRERSSDFRFETFGNQLLPIPLKEEQDMIVEYITVKCEKIDNLKSGLQQEIEKVKQYKQRLISDVVTGQIKVC